MEAWWDELDDAVVACLEGCESMEPAEIARRLGIPETAVVSLLGMLAREGRVGICRVATPSAPERRLLQIAA